MGECNGIVGWIDMPWIQHGVGGTMTKPWPCTTLPVSSSPCIAHHQQTFSRKMMHRRQQWRAHPAGLVALPDALVQRIIPVKVRIQLTSGHFSPLTLIPCWSSYQHLRRWLWGFYDLPGHCISSWLLGRLLNRIQKQIQLHRTAPAVPVRCIKQSTVNWNRVDYMKLISIRSWWADEADEHYCV